jgi:hypothetical protein
VRCICLVFRRLGLHGIQLCMHFRGWAPQRAVCVGSFNAGTGCVPNAKPPGQSPGGSRTWTG